MTTFQTPRLGRLARALTSLGFLLPACAVAQVTPMPVSDEAWQFSVGGGVFYRPEYPGSRDMEFTAVPLASANYGRFFLGGTPAAGTPLGLGAFLIRNEAWRVGVVIGGDLDKPREASDAPLLEGWGDIRATALASAFVTYSHQWLSVRAVTVSDIGGHDQGTRVALDLEGRYSPTDGLVLSAGPGVVWSSSDYMQTFFGINAEQSAIAGVPQYDANSGVSLLRFSLGATYRISERWSAGARATAGWLQGDAADSPVTEDKSQNVYGVFVNYQF